MYVVTLSVFHNLAIWLLYVNKPEPETKKTEREALQLHLQQCLYEINAPEHSRRRVKT